VTSRALLQQTSEAAKRNRARRDFLPCRGRLWQIARPRVRHRFLWHRRIVLIDEAGRTSRFHPPIIQALEHLVMHIASKTILITGANRGIGRALVEEALRRGAARVHAGVRGDFRHADPRVTVIAIDVTDPGQVARAAAAVDRLDLLVNNAGISLPDDLGDPALMQRQLDVNVLGMARVTRAFLPLLKRSRGAIVNNLSVAAIAPIPAIPGYSVSKAAAANMSQSLRALLAGEGVTVHAAFIGPTDTDMTRGIDVPKATPAATAQGIFDGLANDEEDIFPDPMSRPLAEGWRQGVAKMLEGRFRAFVPTGSPA
jgi:NAD(P)-dependent dehydrogenase (short-subunit alcohol dehydrogenase family)